MYFFISSIEMAKVSFVKKRSTQIRIAPTLLSCSTKHDRSNLERFMQFHLKTNPFLYYMKWRDV